MGGPAAARLQRRHSPAVLANQLQIAVLWGQPCQAYNVCVRPGAAAAAMLAAVQAGARRLELSLLRVPESALHVNVAWLLPVHQEYDQPKDELWRRRGPGWLAALASAAGQASGFRLRWLSAAGFCVDVEVSELLVIRERVFPSLDYEILHRIGLPSASSAR